MRLSIAMIGAGLLAIGAQAASAQPFAGVQQAPASSAQIQFSGSPQDLGREIVRRDKVGAYPIFGYDLAELQDGAGRLNSLSADEWTLLWSEVGERHFAKAEQAERAGDPSTAQREYNAAYDWYTLARWPGPTTPRRRAAYERSLEAFHAYDRFNDTPAEVLRIPVEGGQITALLRLPKDRSAPAPLYIEIGGLDGYKELLARSPSLAVARAGVATLILDAPGTGQSIKVTPHAWEALRTAIDTVLARPEIDRKRVVLWGGSFGAYWSTVLAYEMGDRFQGIVSHGALLDISRLPQTLATGEYLFDGPAAFVYAVDGARTVDEAVAATRGLSLLEGHRLDRPTPPMLLLNGANDTIVPIGDLLTLLVHGSPKDAWVNPTGIHLGREAGVWDSQRINEEVTLPWVYRKLYGSRSASGGAH